MEDRGVWGYNFIKNVDHFFRKIYPPYHGGMGVYFQSNITSSGLRYSINNLILYSWQLKPRDKTYLNRSFQLMFFIISLINFAFKIEYSIYFNFSFEFFSNIHQLLSTSVSKFPLSLCWFSLIDFISECSKAQTSWKLEVILSFLLPSIIAF